MDEFNINPYNNLLPHKKSWFKKPLFYVLIVLIGIVGYFGYVFGLAYTTIVVDNSGVEVKKVQLDIDNKINPMPEKDTDRFNVLILGIRGENDTENGGLLTDSIEILSINQKTKKASLISIPRDLYIDMLGVRGKINSVYEVGFYKNYGIALTSQLISRLTGVYIDKTIVFDLESFKNIVDSLDGIDIHLTKPFEEASQWGYVFSIPAGDNHINGEQALYYVRSRYSTSDFDRARRQQQVITAIKNRAFSLGLLANPVKITSIFNGLKKNIRTDFQIWDLNHLLALAEVFNNQKSPLKNYVISTENLLVESKTEKGEYILLTKNSDYDSIRELFKNSLNF